MENTLKKNSIGIFSYGRKQSQRCPNKLLRPFGNTTLVDILLSKLSTFGDNAFFAGYDSEFKEKCNEIGVNFVQRTLKSVTIDEPQIEALSFLKKINYEYLLIINGCLPFLKIETINSFLEEVIENGLQSTSAIQKRSNYFFNKEKRPLNFPDNLKNLNTKKISPIYEFANALYFFERKHFLQKGRYWDWEKLKLIQLESKIELLDIDTEEDFVIAESIWEKLSSIKNI